MIRRPILLQHKGFGQPESPLLLKFTISLKFAVSSPHNRTWSEPC